MNLEYSSKTHIGAREINEDAFMQLNEKHWALFAVADGLGGHEAGELAANYFCQGLIEAAIQNKKNLVSVSVSLIQQIINAAAEIMSEKLIAENKLDARTTCAIAFWSKEKLITAHIGDSRVYLIDSNRIEWRTRDHSMTQQLLDKGLITEEEMANHPYQTALLRSVAVNELPDPEITIYPALNPDQLLLLCTDGFWEKIYPAEMMKLVAAKDLDKGLDKLVQTAVQRGGTTGDNVTVQAIRLIK